MRNGGQVTAIALEKARVDALALSHGMTQAEAELIVAGWKTGQTSALQSFITPPSEPIPSSYEELAELALWMVLKEPEAHLSTTGMVVAGFGEHDVFPSHIHYVSSGVVAGKLLFREEGREAVNHSKSADLSAFAQRGMIDTFQAGLDWTVYRDAVKFLDEALQDFGTRVANESGGDLSIIADLAGLRKAATDTFKQKWTEEARKTHALPLQRVLASLPVPEMAELAETLVNLQSLKEKVTKPSEEVGGPIDVAVITKSEGLIWIKRKLFFDATINPRYVARLNGLYK